ncbi:ABC transporter permease [Fulvivirga sp.]|uniref:ABC transporter permease n=1 Tax=Fulvivirga sp. TaxID=1931237 RepID=UPI0032ECE426
MKGINLLLAFRFFKKDKLFTIINLLGLSTAIACIYFIALFVNDELSFDNYHQDNVYRIVLERFFPNTQTSYATTPQPLGYTMQREFSEVQQSSRALPISNFRFENEGKDISFLEEDVLAVDSNFLEMLSIPIKAGELTALEEPFNMAVTEEMAIKYFGTDQVLGQKMLVNDTAEYTITAVVEDVSRKSHLEFDFLLSWESFSFDQFSAFEWVSYNTYNYIKLNDGVDPREFEKLFHTVVVKYVGPPVEAYLGKTIEEYEAAGNIHNFYLQPLSSIHLNSNLQFEMKPNGDMQYVILFSIIGIFILAIASINFTNLSTARSIRRAKEVGIRKTLGSTKQGLFVQFFTESTILCTVSGIIGFILFSLLLPQFNTLAGKELSIEQIDWLVYGPVFVIIIFLVILFSGSYPALFISSFNVVKILKGQVTQGKSNNILRNTLIILQFSISIFLIIGTLIVNKQVDFLINKKLGFKKEKLLTINDTNLLGSSFLSFKNSIEQMSGVNEVSASFHVPGRQVSGLTFEAIGRPSTERYQCGQITGDKNFINTYGLEIVAGRGFEEQRNDSLNVIINETAANEIGWENPIGQKIRPTTAGEVEIIGVIKDFHFNSLHERIRPLIMFGVDLENLTNRNITPPVITVQFEPGIDIQKTIADITKLWEERVTDEQIDYSFLNQEYDELYRSETQFGDIFLTFAVIAIFIALIGLIGLSSFFAIQKTREIGIRKVLGASVNSLVFLMSKEFVKLLVVANLLAWPIAYYVLNDWLQQYPYDVTISFDIFLMAGVLSLILVLLTTGYQSIKSAIANPVKSIRTE